MGAVLVSILIRPARPADAPAVVALRVDSWRVAYAGVIPSSVLDAMDPNAYQRFQARLRDPEHPFRTRVAERDGVIAGYTITGPYRGEDVPPGAGEVLAIYAHPDHWSTGVGRELMSDALTELARLGLAPVLLWVLRDNPRARRFYERAGFRPDGTEQPYTADGVSVPEVRYRRDAQEPDGVQPGRTISCT